MATNNFKPFAAGAGANVTSQAEWEALSALLTGFQSGKAVSAHVNKALRQGTVVASVIAQFIADSTGQDVLDDGNTAELLTNFMNALTVNTTGRLLNVQVFTESGTYKPTDGTKKIIVEIVGGGGSGGGTSNLQVGSFCIGSGGGAGGYIKALIKDIVDEYSVIVGAKSGTSIFGDSLLVAKGGYNGDTFIGSPTSGSVLEEEVSSSIRGGDVTYSPLPMVLTALPGAAGSYGYSISAGLKFGGNGGSNPLGNGGVFPGLIPGLTSRAGSDGTGYGSGGSGSVLISTESLDSVSGGEGMPGIVIIYEYA